MPEHFTTPRCFRFGLRTLFVVVTVVSIWFGYHVNWIRQRHAMLRESGVRYGFTVLDPPDILPPGEGGPEAPATLRMFCEPAVWKLYVSAKNVERGRRLFPEADIHEAMPMRNRDILRYSPLWPNVHLPD